VKTMQAEPAAQQASIPCTFLHLELFGRPGLGSQREGFVAANISWRSGLGGANHQPKRKAYVTLKVPSGSCIPSKGSQYWSPHHRRRQQLTVLVYSRFTHNSCLQASTISINSYRLPSIGMTFPMPRQLATLLSYFPSHCIAAWKGV
jgi:hypothetical protein